MKRKNFCFIMLSAVVILLQFHLVHPSSVAASSPNCSELIKDKCVKCHSETRICQKVKKGRGKSSWKNTIKSMLGHGAAVSRAEQKSLVVCLSTPDSTVLGLCKMDK
jgi:hypothetical protein